MVIQVSVGDNALLARLNAMPDKVRSSLKAGMTKLALDLIEYIKSTHLSAPEGFSATDLHRVSGQLQRSLQQKVTADDRGVSALVYTDKTTQAYAYIHEYGASFNKMVHMAWGKEMKEPHEAHFNYPDRSFMRSSLKEQTEVITDGIKEAVAVGLK